MAVVVMMVVVGADGFELGWSAAAVEGLAAGDFELDGGVGDLEAVAQGAVDAVEDGAALGHGHLGDGDVAGEGVRVGAETPDMQVMDVLNTVDGLQGKAYLRQRTTSRCPL